MKNIFFFLITGIFLFQTELVFSQPTPPGNLPSKNTGRSILPSGPSVMGVFDGRIPCQEFAKEFNIKTIPECTKIKYRITFYVDSITGQPSNYIQLGTLNREKDRVGKWAIIKGSKTDPDAVIYQLDPDKPQESLFLLKGDDNVLFFLDKNRNFLVGNGYFSFTLNRVTN